MEMNENYFAATKVAVQEYVEERLLLLKLQGVKVGGQAAGAVTVAIIALLLVIGLLVLLGITGGLLIASFTGNYLSGFAIITGIYLLLIIIIAVWARRPIENYINNTVIKKVFSPNTPTPNNNDHG